MGDRDRYPVGSHRMHDRSEDIELLAKEGRAFFVARRKMCRDADEINLIAMRRDHPRKVQCIGRFNSNTAHAGIDLQMYSGLPAEGRSSCNNRIELLVIA